MPDPVNQYTRHDVTSYEVPKMKEEDGLYYPQRSTALDGVQGFKSIFAALNRYGNGLNGQETSTISGQ